MTNADVLRAALRDLAQGTADPKVRRWLGRLVRRGEEASDRGREAERWLDSLRPGYDEASGEWVW